MFFFFTIVLIVGLWFLRVYFQRPKQLPEPEQCYPDRKWLEIDGFRLPYVQRGCGPEHIVLIHGLASWSYCWRHVMDPLSKTHTVTAFDLLGFGDADKPTQADYSLDAQTQRVERVLQTLQIERATVIAHSMGGAIAIHLARRKPLQVVKLILIAPALYPELIIINPKYFRWAIDLVKNFIVTPWLVKKINKRSAHESMRWESIEDITLNYYRPYHKSREALEVLLAHHSLLKDPRPSNSERVKPPALILYSQKDRLLRINSLHSFLKRHPHIRAVEDLVSAHQMMEENPNFVLDQIQKFLKK